MTALCLAFRERHGLSQETMAKLLRVPNRTVQRWDRMDPPHAYIFELALAELARRQEISAQQLGPAATLYPLKERQRQHAAGDRMVYMRGEDGRWLTREEMRALPPGATFWWTGDSPEGRWTQRKSEGPGFSPTDTGGRDRWPPYEWWKE